jgi:release factor glutamine methyltransferase
MDPAGNLVKYLIRNFRVKLYGLYPDQEIMQFIYLLFEAYLGWHKSKVHLSLETELPGSVLNLFNMALVELQAGRPIQYILGHSWFNGTLLKVDSNVLVPRPETEELCAVIKADCQGMENDHLSILDIGTGSGCIAIDLKKHFPCSTVTALDNSRGALKIAGENARSNHCAISFIHADIMNQADLTGLGKFNLIVSNPPYVLESEKRLMHRNVLEFEPGEALFVGDEDPLLFYRVISAFAVSHLIPPARLYFEINERFAGEVAELVLAAGFDDIRKLNDFHGKARFVTAILIFPSDLPL